MSAAAHNAAGLDAENPWLGLDAFSEAARDYFFGRDEEIADLLRRVRRKSLTVLFGQSGLGKTSLLQAGLFPRLRLDGFLPVYIRLAYGADAPPLPEQVRERIAQTLSAGGFAGGAPAGEPLWSWFHQRGGIPSGGAGSPLRIGLVFDQFEEIFTVGAAGANRLDALLAELGDLIENRVPSEVEAMLDASEDATARFDFNRDDHRVLIALREDFLPHLEDLRAVLPSLTQNRMRLTPMKGPQALDAVLKPGGALVPPEVAAEIVRFVAAEADAPFERLEVDPSLLNLFCHELNNQRRKRHQPQITSDLLAGSRDAILRDFYERCMDAQPAAVRTFVEDELVTDSGYRENIALERAAKTLAAHGVPPEAIPRLVNRRLLRIEERLEVQRVELTHDILTGVVCASRAERRAREEKEAGAKREREAEEARHQAETRERAARHRLRLARATISVMLVLLAGAIVAARMAYLATQEARRATGRTAAALKEVDTQRAAAERERNTAETERNRAYAVHAALSLSSWQIGRIGRARELLEDPGAGAQAGRRNWEWYYVNGLCQLSEASSRTLTGHTDDVNALLFMPDPQDPTREVLVSASADRTVRFWDFANPKTTGPRTHSDLGFYFAKSAKENGYFVGPLFPGGPAERDGRLTPFQLITKISLPDGSMAAAAGLSEQEFSAIARGEPGGRVRLAVRAADADEGTEKIIELTREPVGAEFAHDDAITTLTSGHPQVLFYGGGSKYFGWNFVSGKGGGSVAGNLLQVAASPSAKAPRLAVLHENKKSVTIASQRARPEREVATQGSLISTIRFAPDGRLATGSERGEVKIWNEEITQPVWEYQGPASRCQELAFSPDDRYFAVLVSGKVRLFTREMLGAAKERQPQLTPLRPNSPAYDLAITFSPSGNQLATGGSDGVVRIWSTSDGKLLRAYAGHSAPVRAVAFSGDGRMLASAGLDRSIRLWQLTQAMPQKSRRVGVVGNETVGVAYSADGRYLAAADPFYKAVEPGSDAQTAKPGRVTILDAATGAEIRNVPGLVYRFGFSPVAPVLAVPQTDGDIQMIEAPTGKILQTLHGHQGEVRAVSFSPDGKQLLTGGEDRTARVWDLATGTARTLGQYDAPVRLVAFSPDSRQAAIGIVGMGLVVLLDPAGKEAPVKLSARIAGFGLRYSPDGSLLLAGEKSGRIRAWDPRTGKEVRSFDGITALVWDLAFTPDGRRLVSVSDDNTMRLWDVAWRRELTILDDSFSAYGTAFSPDGWRLAVSERGYLRLWDAGLLSADPPPQTPLYFHTRAEFSRSFRQWPQTLADATRAIELDGQNADLWRLRGRAAAELENWTEAMAAFAEALRLDPEDRHLHYQHSLVQYRLGNVRVWNEEQRWLLEEARRSGDPGSGNTAAWSASVHPPADGEVSQFVDVVRAAVGKMPKEYTYASTYGSILVRAKRYEDALVQLRKAMDLKPVKAGSSSPYDGSALDWVFMAMAHAKAGRRDEALRWLEQTRAQIRRINTDPIYEDPNWTWNWSDRMEMEALLREVTEMLEAPRP